MKYNILAISDIHWGAIEAKRLYNNLQLVISTIEDKKDKLDLVVICGDYFDYKLTLNSKSAILSIQFMNELYDICKKYNIPIRIIKGTHEHDNNQLEAFRNLEDDKFFKIFTENTFEETLPELNCLYCPDENIPTKDYLEKYRHNILNIADIGFFHGSFDIVLPDIVVQQSEDTNNTNVIFNYELFSSMINGPLIAGHWHNSSYNNPLIYIGSFDRWAFGEEDDKGFILISIDTDTKEYDYHRVINTNAIRYDTIIVDTLNLSEAKSYSDLIDSINSNYDLQVNKVRVLIRKSTDRSEDEDYINAFKKYYINNKNIRIDVKDLIKINKKKEVKRTLNDINDKYSFIRDGKDPSEVIQEFILVNSNKSIPIDDIRKYVDPLLDK